MQLDGWNVDGDPIRIETRADGVHVVDRTPDGPRERLHVPYERVRHAAVGAFARDADAESPDGLELMVGHLPEPMPGDNTDADLTQTWLGFRVTTSRFSVAQVDDVVTLADEIRGARVRHQRTSVPHGSLAAPRRGPDGLRPDVEQAARRCTVALEFADVAAASYAARDDEYVLELSTSKGKFLVVVTTLRLFLIPRVNWTGDVAESPIDSFLSFASTHAQIPGTPCLALSRGSTHVYFVLDTPAEAERLVGGARFALDVLTRDDAPRPVAPSTTELFERWRALGQASELGTLDPDDLATLARELYVAARAS